MLITRPEQQAAKSAAYFEKRGYKTICFPVLKIVSLVTAGEIAQFFTEKTCDGIVVTSQQPINGLEEVSSLQSSPLYALGEATAEAARSAGFANVIVANGDAESLAGILPQGTFLYLRGEDISVDLTELAHAHLIEMIAYRAETVTDSHLLFDALEQRPDVVLFYSARSVQSFEAMLGNHPELLSKLTAVAISAKVAASLRVGWGQIAQSATPDEAGMLKVLESLRISRKQA